MKNTRFKIFLMVCAAGLCLVLGLYRVHHQHQIIRVGYELGEARLKLRKLQDEQSALRLEETFLKDPGRIEEIATGLGMIRPTPEQLRVVRPKSVALRKKRKGQ